MKIINRTTGEVVADGVSASSADNLYFNLYIDPIIDGEDEEGNPTFSKEPVMSQEEFDAIDIQLEYTAEERTRYVRGNIAAQFAETRADKGEAAMALAGVNNDVISTLVVMVSALSAALDDTAKAKVIAQIAKTSGATKEQATLDFDAIRGVNIPLPYASKTDKTVSGVVGRLTEMNLKVKEEITKN